MRPMKRPYSNFNNILKVLKREKPERPTLFEFSINKTFWPKLAEANHYDLSDEIGLLKLKTDAFGNAGYDYVTMHACPDFIFNTNRVRKEGEATISLNHGSAIHDWESFEKYSWPDPGAADYSRLEKMEKYLPDGMKIIVYGPGGVLENVIALTGYENLCYMLVDEPELVKEIFDGVGRRFVRYYEIAAGFDSVGALMSNDDWGFNTQPMLSLEDMRKYVIPWHKKIAEAIHAAGKPAILHSCGKLDLLMDDIIDVIGYDAKHSYEDNILPVEKAYEKYGGRIAVLGGIDLDFICRSTPGEVYNRAAGMLALSVEKGGYALGSGNSIPDYTPFENYMAMISAAK